MHGHAAYAAQVAQAIKASGAIVHVRPAVLVAVLKRGQEPLVVVSQGGVFRKHWRYLTPYKGLVFFARSDLELVLPPRCEIMSADKIWLPE